MSVFGEKDFVQINTSMFSRPLFDGLVNEPAPALIKEFIQELTYIFRVKNDFNSNIVRKKDNSYEITIENKDNRLNFKNDEAKWNEFFGKLLREIEYYETFYSIKVTARNDEKINFNYLAIVQMFSEYFVITSRNNDESYKITYKDGELVDIEGSKEEHFDSYIKFEFKFNDYYFKSDIPYKEPEISKQELNDIVKTLALLNVSCKFNVYDEIFNDSYTYQFSSIRDYVDKNYGFDNAWTYYVEDNKDEHCVFCDTYYEWTKTSIALYPSTEEQHIEVYCNNRKLKYGAPFDAIRNALADCGLNYSAVVKMYTRNPMWSDESRVGINNDVIYKKIYDETIATIGDMELWYKVLSYVKDKLTEVAYKLWIEQIRFKGIDKSRAILQFHADLNKNMFFNNYSDLLQDAFEKSAGVRFDIIDYEDFKLEDR